MVINNSLLVVVGVLFSHFPRSPDVDVGIGGVVYCRGAMFPYTTAQLERQRIYCFFILSDWEQTHGCTMSCKSRERTHMETCFPVERTLAGSHSSKCEAAKTAKNGQMRLWLEPAQYLNKCTSRSDQWNVAWRESIQPDRFKSLTLRCFTACVKWTTHIWSLTLCWNEINSKNKFKHKIASSKRDKVEWNSNSGLFGESVQIVKH